MQSSTSPLAPFAASSKQMSEAEFGRFGLGQWGYIHAVVEDGEKQWMLRDAEGDPLVQVDRLDLLHEIAKQNGLLAMSVN